MLGHEHCGQLRLSMLELLQEGEGVVPGQEEGTTGLVRIELQHLGGRRVKRVSRFLQVARFWRDNSTTSPMSHTIPCTCSLHSSSML